MATNNEVLLTWSFLQKCAPSAELMELLVPGEKVVASYKTVRDIAAITNKRIVIIDSQGITGKKKEIYSLPFRSIDMWSTENAGHIDINAELELWTKAGHFKIKVDRKCDVREFDEILASSILD